MPAAPAGAASSASTVTIADLCSCTGPEASTISQTSDTMQAWASWVNSHGGLAGHQVHLVILDDGYSAAKALTNAETAINQDHAVAIFDNSDEDPSFASSVQAAHVPVLGGQESDSGYKNSDFFPAGATFNYTNSVGAIIAKAAGVKKMAAVYCVEVAICAESVHQGEQVAAALRNQVRLHVEHRVRRPELHGPVPGGQAIRCHRYDGGRRLLGRRARRLGLRSAGLHAAPALERRHGRGRMAQDSGVQRQHRHAVGQPVVPPQLRDVDDVCGAGQVRAAGAQRAQLRRESCCNPGRTALSCRKQSKPPAPRAPLH